MKNFLLCSVLGIIFITLVNTKVQADEQLIYVPVRLSERYIHYTEVVAKYGEIWIGYLSSNINVTLGGKIRFVMDKAYYFYKKDSEYILLGSIDENGVYDKNGICIKTPPSVSAQYIILGISSFLIENPLGPAFILQAKADSDNMKETNPIAIIDFDTEQDTIKIMEINFH